MEVITLSLGRILKALESLGLSHTEARIYVFLEKNGSQEERNIAKILKLRMHKLAINLKNLQDKKIVRASCKEKIKFSAIPFEEVINLIIEVKEEQAKTLQASKEELLSSWRSITEKNDEKS